MPAALVYVGAGAALPDVPARDLSTDDLQTIADRQDRDAIDVQTDLLASELYSTTPETTPVSAAIVRTGVVTLTDTDSAPIVFSRLMPTDSYQVLLQSADAPDGLGAWITDPTTAGCTVNVPDVMTGTIDYLAIADT
jgi:hypothetical protein